MAKSSPKPASVPVVEVLPPLKEELALAPNDGGVVSRFMSGLSAFIGQANAIEVAANQTLARAQAWKVPTLAAEDELLQADVRHANASKSAAEKLWNETIAGPVFRLHKRLVAHRQRPVAALEKVAEIGNRLHNTFVAAERERVAAEQRRVDALAQQEAQRRRDAELAELERQALANEAASGELSAREKMFVGAVLDGADQVFAAKHAGYKDSAVQGARLFASDKIQKAIEARRTADAIRQQAAAVKEAPLQVESETVEMATGGDRTNRKAEITDEAALIDAVIAGKHGIPKGILMVNQTVLNQHARALGELINLWPGVRLKKDTRIV